MPDPTGALVKYPHQFSGGQLQRISIAIALACAPKLLIADEPTTALDVTIQAQILELIHELVASSELAVLFITHDLGVLATLANRVAVMRRGVMMETQPSMQLYKSPQTDYTRELLAAVPQLKINPEPAASEADERPLLLEVSNLVKTYESARGPVHAVRDVSFSVREGESVAVVGESGSGKSTAAMASLKLTDPTSGKVIFMGEDFLNASHRERRQLRRNFGVVFQNPYSSLNPRMRIAAILSEALKASGDYNSSEINTRITDAIKRVGLTEAQLKRYPNAFSGGQRQRIAIARALVMSPKLIILDEPTAALDVIVQAQVLDLLEELRVKDGLSYLFITHDLAAVPDIASRVLVMYRGEIVESGPVNEVFAKPSHPYTQTLLDAIPVPDPERAKRVTTTSGE
ncbi:MAG: ABC transporter ATP-binding protein [Verrucomicrobiota bacterium]